MPSVEIIPVNLTGFGADGKHHYLQVDTKGNLRTGGPGDLGPVVPIGYVAPVALSALDPDGVPQLLRVDASGNLKISGSGLGGVTTPDLGTPSETGVVQHPVQTTDIDIALTTPPTTVVIGSVFLIDQEYMTVNDISNIDNPGVTRGSYGSVVATHDAGTPVTIWGVPQSSGGVPGPVGPPGPQGEPGPQGPEGPTAVSTDVGNKATLGSDNLIYVSKLGVTDGSEANPGEVGEYVVQANAAGVQIASDTPSQICAITLTPGAWEIWGCADFLPDSNKSPNMICASISLYPDALPTDEDLFTGVGVMTLFFTPALTSGQRQVLMTGQCRANSSTPLTVYIVAETSFSGGGSVSTKGYISARRVR